MYVYGNERTIGSTSLTPLSSGGLCEAVIITPIHLPLSFRERRAAMRPTRVKTESSTSLLLSAELQCRTSSIMWGGGRLRSTQETVQCRRMSEAKGNRTLLFGTTQAFISTSFSNYELFTYPSCSVRVYMALGRGMLLRSIDDGIGHFQGR
jgi:hypothetical protein